LFPIKLFRYLEFHTRLIRDLECSVKKRENTGMSGMRERDLECSRKERGNSRMFWKERENSGMFWKNRENSGMFWNA
jgi:hypothetical protein